MAVLPIPLSWFTIPAGGAFAEQLSLPGVIAAALAAVAVQITLCYWAARKFLRPWAEAWLKRTGWAIPRVARDDALSVILLVRLTPGPPLSVGCFLLGLAEVPFGIYLVASWLLTVPWVVGGVVFGRGVLNANLQLIAVGVAVLLAAVFVVRVLRRRQKTTQTG